MLMWTEWEDPKTSKKDRIYNFSDVDEPTGRKVIGMTGGAPVLRFRLDLRKISAFLVRVAPSLPMPYRNDVLRDSGPAESTALPIPQKSSGLVLATFG
jgi:hypothetical protein